MRLTAWLIVVLTAIVSFAVVAPAAQATFPGKNGKIAFDGGDGNIYSVRPDGSGLSVLIPGAAHPVWSADGTKIAFVDPSQGLSIANADGSDRRSLGAEDFTPCGSWSPDSSKVLASKRDDPFDTWTVDVNTGGVQVLLRGSATLALT